MLRLSRTTVLAMLVLLLVMATASAQERTKVTVWLIGQETTGSYGQVWQQIEPHIEQDLPHLDVEVLFGVSPDQRFSVAYAAGIAPDVVTLLTSMSPQFINAGMVSPIDYEAFGVKDANELKDLFYPGSLRSMYVNDEIYFMPVELTTFGMYYNKDLMGEFGVGPNQVPTTWNEIIDIGKKFMRRNADGNSFDTVGVAINNSWLWPTYRTAALVRQSGTDWMVDGKAQFTHPNVVSTMDLYASLYHENQVTMPNVAKAGFINQQAPFYLGPSYEMRATEIPASVNFDLGTSGYPSVDPDLRVSTSYAWGLYVSSTSQVQKEAWEVINYLTSERWAPTWFETSALLIPRSGDWIMDVIHNQPNLAPFIVELEYAQMEIVTENYQGMNAALVAAEQAMLNRTDRKSVV